MSKKCPRYLTAFLGVAVLAILLLGWWTLFFLRRPRLPRGLDVAFEVPSQGEDSRSNLVRRGTDPGTTWPLEIRHKSTEMHLVFVPAGEFVMGSPDGEEDRHDDEGLAHKVRITKPFYMGKYAVTQAEWRRAMGCNPGNYRGDNYPVEEVSWDDCQEFIQKLNDGLPSPSGRGAGGEGGSYIRFSLPTEAQWEYACRAGTTTRFSFGDDPGYSQLGQYAWYINSAETDPRPVGMKAPNPWGLYDMHGNVYEWCADRYGRYGVGDVVDPTGVERSAFRVLRGASGRFKPWNARSASRFRGAPDFRYFGYGCRVALRVE